jgi:hypothetical protein
MMVECLCHCVCLHTETMTVTLHHTQSHTGRHNDGGCPTLSLCAWTQRHSDPTQTQSHCVTNCRTSRPCDCASVTVHTMKQSQPQGVILCHTTVAHCVTTIGGCLSLSLCFDKDTVAVAVTRHTVTHCVTQSNTAPHTLV